MGWDGPVSRKDTCRDVVPARWASSSWLDPSENCHCRRDAPNGVRACDLPAELDADAAADRVRHDARVAHRRAQIRSDQRRRRFSSSLLSVHVRPFAPQDRSEAGRSAPLVERQTRVLKLIHLERADSISMHRALVRDLVGQPPHVLHSAT